MLFRAEDRLAGKKTVRCAVLSCMALVIYVLESYIPPVVPVPGIKPGLANVVTLASMYILGAREIFFILMVRIILGNIFTGQAVSFIYSMAGGILCFAVTAVLKSTFKGKTIWALGVIGALFHNLGQLLCAFFMLGSGSLIYYGLVLGLASLFTGTFTGLCAQSMIIHFNKIYGGKNNDY